MPYRLIRECRRAVMSKRARQVCVLGSAEPGSTAYEMAGNAGELIARLGITLVSGCGSPATRVAAERALNAGGISCEYCAAGRHRDAGSALQCADPLRDGRCPHPADGACRRCLPGDRWACGLPCPRSV